MDTLVTAQGSYPLNRFPAQKNDPLRAWDAADEYLLQYVAEQQLTDKQPRVLIINDSFGALSVALAESNPAMMSDSFLAHQGLHANLEINKLDSQSVSLLDSLHWPKESFDLILMKIPKCLAMLEDQLRKLRPLLNEDSQFIAASMSKQIHSSTLKLFEKIIGSTKTSLAKKKARLVFSQLDKTIDIGDLPHPHEYSLDNTHYTISNHANVFSREKLDIGTRFFIEHIPKRQRAKTILDLGCGNGVVGLMAAHYSPDVSLQFVDESYMAVDSAKQNFEAAFKARKVKFSVMDCLSSIEKNSIDIILNNPPFHQNNVVGDHIAIQMFTESLGVLKDKGELWVIGNRHLGYHVKLKKLFGNCKVITMNKKFVILKCIKYAVKKG